MFKPHKFWLSCYPSSCFPYFVTIRHRRDKGSRGSAMGRDDEWLTKTTTGTKIMHFEAESNRECPINREFSFYSTVSKFGEEQETEASIADNELKINEFDVLAQSFSGTWITVVKESDSLNELLSYFGVPFLQRAIASKLALKVMIEVNNVVMTTHIDTPLGRKTTSVNLDESEFVDLDPDFGEWKCRAEVVLFQIPDRYGGGITKAIHINRNSDKFGKGEEFRCLINHATQGKSLLIQTIIHPKGGKKVISCNRVVRLIGCHNCE